VDEFDGQHFDYVITVCDNAKESCPVFISAVKRLHHSVDDPPPASQGTEQERMAIFRRVRDELRTYLAEFAHNTAEHHR
jgi:arsenate reductase (thioredoxin)